MAIFINAEATKSLGCYFINRQSHRTQRKVQSQSHSRTQAPEIRRFIKRALGLAGVDKTAIG